MTRREDVSAAALLGAHYVGVIFAGGPRSLTVDRARELMRDLPRSVKRVGVFGHDGPAGPPADVARDLGLDVVQLHGDPDTSAVSEVRRRFDGPVWAALRVAQVHLPARARDLFDAADAVVLDAYSPSALGGTGRTLPWEELASELAPLRTRARLVLAGGLRPDNVAGAIRAMAPDVVDVSSGVELAPGIKDHDKLRAFRDAVLAGGGDR
jgi:phosphoribosylanthranilate isomerase